MKQLCETTLPLAAKNERPQGQILKGKFAEVLRSDKGKLKGLVLQTGDQVCRIELPKYLRPMLVRELMPGAFIQVWAYPEAGIWRAINILPLPDTEISKLDMSKLQQGSPDLQTQSRLDTADKNYVCIQVCTKGKCYKQGSSRLWQSLEAEVAANPELQHVAIESVGCLKACKSGPNLRILPTGRLVSHASPSLALSLLSQN
ncbi:(2Fe-2S) ferredoxin domain-containing protein [Sphaerothrix gracilis]|uniref:(2Fe-2S) ferredoxin domain-containing protein n=1 Tax=Sphaerothrix gracilis TaxID=3151835 RepID=UPI0031FD85BB